MQVRFYQASMDNGASKPWVQGHISELQETVFSDGLGFTKDLLQVLTVHPKLLLTSSVLQLQMNILPLLGAKQICFVPNKNNIETKQTTATLT